MSKTIAVLGGGPGGYVAAIRAAQLGANVHIIENEKFGGTCLNVGCIPTKALLHSAELYENIAHASDFGIDVSGFTLNWDKVQKKKDSVTKRLVGGVEGLLKSNGVKIHKGLGKLKDKNTIEVNGELIKADAIVLATGSYPTVIPFEGHDLPNVIDSTAALSLSKLPESIVIMGGGVIGIEFAGLFATFGVKVKVVELLPEILPIIDSDVVAEVKKELKAKGVEFYTSAKLLSVKQGTTLKAQVEQNGKTIELDGEYVLVAVGRRAKTAGIGLEEAGIQIERGCVVVNEQFETSVKGVYAIGDCNGKIMLAHAASAQGVAAVEFIMGHNAKYFSHIVPSCVYTSPELASVGLSEADAKAKGIAIKVGKFPLAGNGKALIENGGKGFIKVIAGAKYGEVLGVHIIGARATDLIAEAALAMRLEATVEEIVTTIHAHPTVAEGMAEGALAVDNIAVHWPKS